MSTYSTDLWRCATGGRGRSTLGERMVAEEEESCGGVCRNGCGLRSEITGRCKQGRRAKKKERLSKSRLVAFL